MASNSKSDATVVQAPTTAAAEAPGLSVAEEIRSIETTLLTELLAIAAEQARISEYLAHAEQLKDTTEPRVWRRVVDDYTNRRATLERRAAPLKAQARGEYEKLEAIFERIKARREEIRLEKETLEFRRSVGELEEADCAERMAAPLEALQQCETDLAAVEEQRAKFRQAFGSDLAAVRADAPPAAAPPSPAPAEPPAPADPKVPAASGSVVSVAAGGAAPAPEAAEDGDVLETLKLGRHPRSPEAANGAPIVATVPAGAGAPEGRTLLLPIATLVVSADGDGPAEEHRLGALNNIGRSQDNQICIVRPGVSRRHASIVLTEQGFALRDLQSQNGTFVNGARITEAVLAGGDRIRMGNAEIVFTVSRPGPASTSHPSGSA